jgi:hypothetical protein
MVRANIFYHREAVLGFCCRLRSVYTNTLLAQSVGLYTQSNFEGGSVHTVTGLSFYCFKGVLVEAQKQHIIFIGQFLRNRLRDSLDWGTTCGDKKYFSSSLSFQYPFRSKLNLTHFLKPIIITQQVELSNHRLIVVIEIVIDRTVVVWET